MANPIYDIAAISTDSLGALGAHYGTMSTTASSGAGDAVSQQVANLADAMMGSAGWIAIASSTANSRVSKDYISAQVPWFDPDNVPSWYTATDGIVWLRVDPTASATQIRFTVGKYNGTTGTSTSSLFSITLSGATGRLHTIHASPYQMFFHDRGNAAVSFHVTSPHVPDFAQEALQIKTVIEAHAGSFLSSVFFVNNQNAYSYYETNLGTAPETWFGNANLTLRLAHQAPPGVRSQTNGERYIWNPAVDPAMNTATSGHPMICPAVMTWDTSTFAGAGTNTNVRAIGMLWDCVFVNRRIAVNSTISRLPNAPEDKRLDWVCLATSDADATRQPGSLFVITGTST